MDNLKGALASKQEVVTPYSIVPLFHTSRSCVYPQEY